MKNYLLLLFFLFPFFSADAQEEIDPRRKELLDHLDILDTCKTNSLRLQSLIIVCSRMRLYDLDSAYVFCSQAIELAGEIKSDSLRLEALEGMVVVLKRANRYEEMLETSLAGLQLAKKMGNSEKEANFLLEMGDSYERTGQAEKAAKVWLEGLEIARKVGKNSLIGIALINLGNGYYYQSAFDKALSYYQEAYDHYRKAGESFWMHTAASNIAECYRLMGTPEKGMPLADKAISFFDSVGNDQMLYYPLNNKAEFLLESGDLKALQPVLQRLELLANMPPNLEKQTRLYDQFARLAIAGNNWTKASDYAEKTLRSARMLDDKNLLSAALKTRILTLEKMQQFKDAFSLMKELQILSDSIASSTAKAAYDELNLKYQSEQKDLLLAENNLNLQRQQSNQRLLILFLVVFIIISVSIFLMYRQRKIVHEREIESARQKLLIESMRAMIQGEEKERARLARELHDGVGGMLSAIKMKASTLSQFNSGTESEIISLLDKTSAEIRMTAHNLMPELLNRFGLVEALKDYIQQIRNDNERLIEFQAYRVPADIPKEIQLNIYRIAQELINNAWKHSGATEILVQLSGTSEQIILNVEDNGSGILNEKSRGIGLDTINHRVKWMGGKWDLQSHAGQGVFHQIEVPLNS